MKLYKKENLEYVNGMLVDPQTNEIVMPEGEVVREANYLERSLQKQKWEAANEATIPCVKPESFKFKSERRIPDMFVAETPELDKQVEQSIKLMDEIEDAQTASKINDAIRRDYANLFKFVASDQFVACDPNFNAIVWEFDLLTVGNPLELTTDKLTELIANSYGIFATDSAEE